MRTRVILILLLIVVPAMAWGEITILQSKQAISGHIPQYGSPERTLEVVQSGGSDGTHSADSGNRDLNMRGSGAPAFTVSGVVGSGPTKVKHSRLLNNMQRKLLADGPLVGTTPFDFIPVAQHAAIVSSISTYDVTADLQAMFNSGATIFSFQNGTYNISNSLLIPNNATIIGNGATILAPDTGWPSVGAHGGLEHAALFVLPMGGSNIKISGFHFYGAKANVLANNIKCLSIQGPSHNIEIFNNFFEHNQYECIWPGGDVNSTGISIHNNYFKNLSYPAGTNGSLNVVDPEGVGYIVHGNYFEDVGDAIGGAADMISIVGNVIDGIHGKAISIVNEVNSGNGLGSVIANNVIRYSTDPTSFAIGRQGISVKLGKQTDNIIISGNTFTINGTTGQPAATAINIAGGLNTVYITSNTINFDENPNGGTGIYLQGALGALPGQLTAYVTNNIINYSGPGDGTKVFGILGIPGGAGSTLNATLAGNTVTGVKGTAPDSGFAYELTNGSGGILIPSMINNVKTSGQVGTGATTIGTTQDNNYAYTYPAIAPPVLHCGITSTCANKRLTGTQIVSGGASLVSGTPSAVTISGINPPYTSASSYQCTANDNTAASVLKVTYVSGSSITIIGPNNVTDVVGYICIGF